MSGCLFVCPIAQVGCLPSLLRAAWQASAAEQLSWPALFGRPSEQSDYSSLGAPERLWLAESAPATWRAHVRPAGAMQIDARMSAACALPVSLARSGRPEIDVKKSARAYRARPSIPCKVGW